MVTWQVWSARSTYPMILGATPFGKILPGDLMSSGGQAVAQSPLQVDFGGSAESLSNRYSVRPAPSLTYSPMSSDLVTVNSTVWWPARDFGGFRSVADGPLKIFSHFCTFATVGTGAGAPDAPVAAARAGVVAIGSGVAGVSDGAGAEEAGDAAPAPPWSSGPSAGCGTSAVLAATTGATIAPAAATCWPHAAAAPARPASAITMPAVLLRPIMAASPSPPPARLIRTRLPHDRGGRAVQHAGVPNFDVR